MKKVLCLILTLAACLCMAVPASAADSDFTIVDGVLTEYTGSGSSVTIPDGVTEIGEMAFYSCDMVRVSIPDSVTAIGKSAFFGCEKLTSVSIGNGVTTIGENAFRFCTALTEIVLPDSVTTIGDYAFHGCDNLKSIIIPDSVTSIAWGAFSTHIDSAEYSPIPNLTIYGASGSYAESYARDNELSFPFVAIVGNFYDVAGNAYYADAVKWAVNNGVTSGTSANTFSPDQSCTRAQAVTFLWRAAGSPEPAGNASFSDVPVGSYYEKAVKWAVENEITSGTGGGKFSPDATCSRAQIVTFQWRAAGSPETTGTASFTDIPVGSYYENAVKWAVENEITSGTGGGKFSPDSSCTRGQIVTFLNRAEN